MPPQWSLYRQNIPAQPYTNSVSPAWNKWSSIPYPSKKTHCKDTPLISILHSNCFSQWACICHQSHIGTNDCRSSIGAMSARCCSTHSSCKKCSIPPFFWFDFESTKYPNWGNIADWWYNQCPTCNSQTDTSACGCWRRFRRCSNSYNDTIYHSPSPHKGFFSCHRHWHKSYKQPQPTHSHCLILPWWYKAP